MNKFKLKAEIIDTLILILSDLPDNRLFKPVLNKLDELIKQRIDTLIYRIIRTENFYDKLDINMQNKYDNFYQQLTQLKNDIYLFFKNYTSSNDFIKEVVKNINDNQLKKGK